MLTNFKHFFRSFVSTNCLNSQNELKSLSSHATKLYSADLRHIKENTKLLIE